MSKQPLSVSDLRSIADSLEAWNSLLLDDFGEYTAASAVVSSINVELPEDPGATIGKFVLQDGWIGFEPGGDK